MLRYFEIAGAILLICLAVLVILFRHSIASVAVVPALVFLRGIVWRLGLRKGLVFLILPFIPFALRHRGRRNLSGVSAHCHAVARLARRRWQRLPRPFRLALAIAIAPVFLFGCGLALFAGGVLGFLAFVLPIRIGTSTIVGEWLQTRCLPVLARLAAAHGLHNLFLPVLADVVPQRTRDWVHRRYRRLWWSTMRQLINDRQVLGRRTAVLARYRRAGAAGVTSPGH